MLVCACAPVFGAETKPLKVGDPFPAFTAKDQHEKDYQFTNSTRHVLITFDMATGKKVNKALAAEGAEFLDKHHAVYIANIHGMPGIGRFFALPKMRKYPHRIILADQEHLLDPFPQKPDQATYLTLDAKAVIQSVEFWDPQSKNASDILR